MFLHLIQNPYRSTNVEYNITHVGVHGSFIFTLPCILCLATIFYFPFSERKKKARLKASTFSSHARTLNVHAKLLIRSTKIIIYMLYTI